MQGAMLPSWGHNCTNLGQSQHSPVSRQSSSGEFRPHPFATTHPPRLLHTWLCRVRRWEALASLTASSAHPTRSNGEPDKRGELVRHRQGNGTKPFPFSDANATGVVGIGRVHMVDRLQGNSLETMRSLSHEGDAGMVAIEMPGIEKRVARFATVYSRIGFVHEFRPLGEALGSVAIYGRQLGLSLSCHGRGTRFQRLPRVGDQRKPPPKGEFVELTLNGVDGTAAVESRRPRCSGLVRSLRLGSLSAGCRPLVEAADCGIGCSRCIGSG